MELGGLGYLTHVTLRLNYRFRDIRFSDSQNFGFWGFHGGTAPKRGESTSGTYITFMQNLTPIGYTAAEISVLRYKKPHHRPTILRMAGNKCKINTKN